MWRIVVAFVANVAAAQAIRHWVEIPYVGFDESSTWYNDCAHKNDFSSFGGGSYPLSASNIKYYSCTANLQLFCNWGTQLDHDGCYYENIGSGKSRIQQATGHSLGWSYAVPKSFTGESDCRYYDEDDNDGTGLQALLYPEPNPQNIAVPEYLFYALNGNYWTEACKTGCEAHPECMGFVQKREHNYDENGGDARTGDGTDNQWQKNWGCMFFARTLFEKTYDIRSVPVKEEVCTVKDQSHRWDQDLNYWLDGFKNADPNTLTTFDNGKDYPTTFYYKPYCPEIDVPAGATVTYQANSNEVTLSNLNVRLVKQTQDDGDDFFTDSNVNYYEIGTVATIECEGDLVVTQEVSTSNTPMNRRLSTETGSTDCVQIINADGDYEQKWTNSFQCITAAPTGAPTTQEPTLSPTTAAPTTGEPTVAPTLPTASPTNAPTPAPTLEPTTAQPTAAPVPYVGSCCLVEEVTSSPTTSPTPSPIPTPPLATGKAQPNIVFVMLDDAGFNDVGWHSGYQAPDYTTAKSVSTAANPTGGQYFKTDVTPELTKLAHAGIRLENMHSQPVCSPARASLMTGLYEPVHGVGPSVIKPCDAHGVPLKFEFFTEKLKDMGYRNYMIGKWHLGTASVDMMPTARGFDYYAGNVLGEQDWFTHFRTPGYDSADGSGAYKMDPFLAQSMHRSDVRESAPDDLAEWPTPPWFDGTREDFVAAQKNWDETTAWTLDDMILEFVGDGIEGSPCEGKYTAHRRINYKDVDCEAYMNTLRLQWETQREKTFIDNVMEAEIKRVLEEHLAYDIARGGEATRTSPDRHTPFFLYLPIMQPHLTYNVDVDFSQTPTQVETLVNTHLVAGERIDWSDRLDNGPGYADWQGFSFVDDGTYEYAAYSNDMPNQDEWPDDIQAGAAVTCAAPNWSEVYGNGDGKYCNDRMSYEMMMRNVDSSIARVIEDVLTPLALWDDTIFIVTSDNGGIGNTDDNEYNPNYPFRGFKKSYKDGGVRVPAFVHDRACNDAVGTQHLGGSVAHCESIKENGVVSHKLMHVTDWYKTILSMASQSSSVPLYNDRFGVTDKIELNSHDFYSVWKDETFFSVPNDDMYSPRESIVFSAGPRCENTNDADGVSTCVTARYRNSFYSNSYGYLDSLTNANNYNADENGFLTQFFYNDVDGLRWSDWGDRYKYNSVSTGPDANHPVGMNAIDSHIDFKCYDVYMCKSMANNKDCVRVKCDGSNCNDKLSGHMINNEDTKQPCVSGFADFLSNFFANYEVLDDLRIAAADFNLKAGTAPDASHRCGGGFVGEGLDSTDLSRTHLIDNVYGSIQDRTVFNGHIAQFDAIPAYDRYWKVGWYTDDEAYLETKIDTTHFKSLFVFSDALQNACVRDGFDSYNLESGKCTNEIVRRLQSDTAAPTPAIDFVTLPNGQAFTRDGSVNCPYLQELGSEKTAASCIADCNIDLECYGVNFNDGTSGTENSRGCFFFRSTCPVDAGDRNQLQGYHKRVPTSAPTSAPTDPPTGAPTPSPTTAAPTPAPTTVSPTLPPTRPRECRTLSSYGFASTYLFVYDGVTPRNCYNDEANHNHQYGATFKPCCADGYVYNPQYSDLTMQCGESEYELSASDRLQPVYYFNDPSTETAANSPHGVQACVKHEALLWTTDYGRINTFPNAWSWDQRPSVDNGYLHIAPAAAVYNTQEELNLRITVKGLVSTVFNEQDLQAFVYVSHPADATHDGLQMCQQGSDAPFKMYATTEDLEALNFHVDLPRCSQKWEYVDGGCTWDADKGYYVDENESRCAWTEPDCDTENGDVPAGCVWREGRNVIGNKWHFQVNFVHCAVPSTNDDTPVGNSLISLIAQFSDVYNVDQDPASVMYPTFLECEGGDERCPFTRQHLWEGGTYLSTDFQALLHDWAVRGCNDTFAATQGCVDNSPFGFRPHIGTDSFLWQRDQRCFNVQVPVTMTIPFNTNPLLSSNDFEFAVGDMVNLGAVTAPPTVPLTTPIECTTELDARHVDADSCYHTPRPNYNDVGLYTGNKPPNGNGYAAPFTASQCNGDGRYPPLWFKNNVQPPSTGDIANVGFGTQYLGYPFRYEFWINREAAENAADGCASPYELFEKHTGLSNYDLTVSMPNVGDGNHGVLVEYDYSTNTPLRRNARVISTATNGNVDDFWIDGFEFAVDSTCNDGYGLDGKACLRNRPDPYGFSPHTYSDESVHGWSVKGHTWEPDPAHNVLESGAVQWIDDNPAFGWKNNPTLCNNGESKTECYQRQPMCMHPMVVCRLHLVFDVDVEDIGLEDTPEVYTENTYYQSAVGQVVWYRDNDNHGIDPVTQYMHEELDIRLWHNFVNSNEQDDTIHNTQSSLCHNDLQQQHVAEGNCRYYPHFNKAEPFMVTYDSWFSESATAETMFTDRKFELRRLQPYNQHSWTLNGERTLPIDLTVTGGAKQQITRTWTGTDLRDWYHDVYTATAENVRPDFDAAGTGGCRGQSTCPSWVLASDAVSVTEDDLHVLRRVTPADGEYVTPCTEINTDGTGYDDRTEAFAEIACSYNCSLDADVCRQTDCRQEQGLCHTNTNIDVTWGPPGCTPREYDWWSAEFIANEAADQAAKTDCGWEKWFSGVVGNDFLFSQWPLWDHEFHALNGADQFGSLRPCRDTSDCVRWFQLNRESGKANYGAELWTLAENDEYHPNGDGTDPQRLHLPKYFNYKPVCGTRHPGGGLHGIDGWNYAAANMDTGVGNGANFLTYNDRRALDWLDEQRHALHSDENAFQHDENVRPMKFCTWYSEDAQQAKQLKNGQGMHPRETWSDQFYGGSGADLTRRSMTRPAPTECYGGCVDYDATPETPSYNGDEYDPPVTELAPFDYDYEVHQGGTNGVSKCQPANGKLRWMALSVEECYAMYRKLHESDNTLKWGGETYGQNWHGCMLRTPSGGDDYVTFDKGGTMQGSSSSRKRLCWQKESYEGVVHNFNDGDGRTCRERGYDDVETVEQCWQFARDDNDLNFEGNQREDRGRCIRKDNLVVWNPLGSRDACSPEWPCVCLDTSDNRRRRRLETSVAISVEESSPTLDRVTYVEYDVECVEDGWDTSMYLCVEDYVHHPTDIFVYVVDGQQRVRVGTTVHLAEQVDTRLRLCVAAANAKCDLGDEVAPRFVWYAVIGMLLFFCALVPLVTRRERRPQRVEMPKVDAESLNDFDVDVGTPLIKEPLRMPWKMI